MPRSSRTINVFGKKTTVVEAAKLFGQGPARGNPALVYRRIFDCKWTPEEALELVRRQADAEELADAKARFEHGDPMFF